MDPIIENVQQRTADHPLSPLHHGAVVKPASACRDAPGRGRVCAIALLLLGYVDASAAEGFTISGTGAALGTMKLLANEFTAGNPGILVTTVPSNGQWIP